MNHLLFLTSQDQDCTWKPGKAVRGLACLFMSSLKLGHHLKLTLETADNVWMWGPSTEDRHWSSLGVPQANQWKNLEGS